jgi:hypothetical protein
MRNDNDSYIRWQNIRISQLGFINNLIIGLSIALLGFIIDFIQTDNLILNNFQKLMFWIGSLLILSSIGIGIFVVINRLEDFKLTAQIARKRENKKNTEDENERTISKLLGKRTWKYFTWQIATFLIGFIAFLVLVFIELQNIII